MSALMPRFIGSPERRLFTVVDGDPSSARAIVVLCPPMLHEHFLSYRLLALIGRRLTQSGLATVRFDYFGSGDSGGDDREFSLAGAAIDTARVIEHARGLGTAPLLLAGVRAGVWPALANASRCERLLLWHPLDDGATWLADLERQDASERSDRGRYPLVNPLPKEPSDDWLLGSRVTASLRKELTDMRWPGQAPAVAIDVAATAGSAALQRWATSRQRVLPAALTDWNVRIDMMQHGLMGAEAEQAVDWIAAPFQPGSAA